MERHRTRTGQCLGFSARYNAQVQQNLEVNGPVPLASHGVMPSSPLLNARLRIFSIPTTHHRYLVGRADMIHPVFQPF